MSTEFLNEIVESTRRAIHSSTYIQMSSESRLPHANVVLFGADAGDDYARTVLEQVQEAIRNRAKCRQMEMAIGVPNSGKAARAAMEKAFQELLEGFDVTVSFMGLTVTWKRHFNL